MAAQRLFLAIACALALVPTAAAEGAAGDLNVSVSRLVAPMRAQRGHQASFAVRYVVRGPVNRSAKALVTLTLVSPTYRYRIISNPTRVHAATWSWSVTDRLPMALTKGGYRVVALVTLTRSDKVVSRATRRASKLTVS